MVVLVAFLDRDAFFRRAVGGRPAFKVGFEGAMVCLRCQASLVLWFFPAGIHYGARLTRLAAA